MTLSPQNLAIFPFGSSAMSALWIAGDFIGSCQQVLQLWTVLHSTSMSVKHLVTLLGFPEFYNNYYFVKGCTFYIHVHRLNEKFGVRYR